MVGLFVSRLVTATPGFFLRFFILSLYVQIHAVMIHVGALSTWAIVYGGETDNRVKMTEKRMGWGWVKVLGVIGVWGLGFGEGC